MGVGLNRQGPSFQELMPRVAGGGEKGGCGQGVVLWRAFWRRWRHLRWGCGTVHGWIGAVCSAGVGARDLLVTVVGAISSPALQADAVPGRSHVAQVCVSSHCHFRSVPCVVIVSVWPVFLLWWSAPPPSSVAGPRRVFSFLWGVTLERKVVLERKGVFTSLTT